MRLGDRLEQVRFDDAVLRVRKRQFVGPNEFVPQLVFAREALDLGAGFTVARVRCERVAERREATGHVAGARFLDIRDLTQDGAALDRVTRGFQLDVENDDELRPIVEFAVEGLKDFDDSRAEFRMAVGDLLERVDRLAVITTLLDDGFECIDGTGCVIQSIDAQLAEPEAKR